MAKLQFKNIQLLAARITSIIPALKADCPSNNEQVILNILKDEAETSEEITETDRIKWLIENGAFYDMNGNRRLLYGTNDIDECIRQNRAQLKLLSEELTALDKMFNRT